MLCRALWRASQRAHPGPCQTRGSRQKPPVAACRQSMVWRMPQRQQSGVMQQAGAPAHVQTTCKAGKPRGLCTEGARFCPSIHVSECRPKFLHFVSMVPMNDAHSCAFQVQPAQSFIPRCFGQDLLCNAKLATIELTSMHTVEIGNGYANGRQSAGLTHHKLCSCVLQPKPGVQ